MSIKSLARFARLINTFLLSIKHYKLHTPSKVILMPSIKLNKRERYLLKPCTIKFCKGVVFMCVGGGGQRIFEGRNGVPVLSFFYFNCLVPYCSPVIRDHREIPWVLFIFPSEKQGEGVKASGNIKPVKKPVETRKGGREEVYQPYLLDPKLGFIILDLQFEVNQHFLKYHVQQG